MLSIPSDHRLKKIEMQGDLKSHQRQENALLSPSCLCNVTAAVKNACDIAFTLTINRFGNNNVSRFFRVYVRPSEFSTYGKYFQTKLCQS